MRFADITCAAALLFVGIDLLLRPGYPLALAAVASVITFWIVLRVVAVCCCGGRFWPSPALLYLLLAMALLIGFWPRGGSGPMDLPGWKGRARMT